MYVNALCKYTHDLVNLKDEGVIQEWCVFLDFIAFQPNPSDLHIELDFQRQK